MKVLIACEYSGIVRDAFLAAGHEAMSCDLLPTESPGPHYQGDIRDVLYAGWDMMIAHPPCTYLTATANKWHKPEYKHLFPNREADREAAITFFKLLYKALIPRICIENPVGIMTSRLRSADQYIQPWQFGHAAAKKTGLWLQGLPLLAPTEVVAPEWIVSASGNRHSPLHYHTRHLPHAERGKARSRFFPGIAAAMAAQWGGPPETLHRDRHQYLLAL